MSGDAILIYGAYGYTGRLCVARAVAQGLRPLVSGRRAESLQTLLDETGLDGEAHVLDANGSAALTATLRARNVRLVLNCAGPFSTTWKPVLGACLEAGAHYLDVTGEIAVFEGVLGRGDACRDAGIVAIPGVGFDVVPTDCLAAMLVEALPDATHLELAFVGEGGGVSRGTARTMLEGLGHGGAARIDGKIVTVPHGWRSRRVEIGGRERTVTSLGWGDVSTAFHTTGIPNVVTYTALPRSVRDRLPWANRLGWLLRRRWVQAWLRRSVDARITGPSAEQRASGATYVWGRVESADGRSIEGRLRTPEGYAFTALSAIDIVRRVLAGDVDPGAWTPAHAFGKDLVGGIDGVVVEPLHHTTGAARASVAPET